MGVFSNKIETNFSTFFLELTNKEYVGSLQNFNYRLNHELFLNTLKKHFVKTRYDVVYRSTGYVNETIALDFPDSEVMVVYGIQKVASDSRNAKIDDDGLEALYDQQDTTEVSNILQELSASEKNINEWAYEGEDVSIEYAYGVVMYYDPRDERKLNKLLDVSLEINKTCTLPSDLITVSRIFSIEYVSGQFQLQSNKIDVQKFVNNVELNYNDDLLEVRQDLIESLNSDEAGFYFFDGAPGTGKTSFLMSIVGDENISKKIVYMPTEAVGYLGLPNFISFAKKELQNTILIIEDSEEVLRSRDHGANNSVSNILNMTSGVYGELMKIKIIATVNTNSSVDKALFRPGRLKFKYTFGPLSVDKCNTLFDKLGIDKKVKEPMILTNIYNYEKKVDYSKDNSKKIGFSS